MKFNILLIAIVIVATAGCSQEAPPAPPAPSAPSAGAVAAAAADVSTATASKQVQPPIGDETFSISPGSFRVCDAANGAITVTAKWNVTAKSIPEVSVYVTAAEGERKLWLNGGTTGESTTGNWVFPDSKFELVERGSEKPLAELTVKAVPCE